MKTDIEFRKESTIKRLKSWIKHHKKPNWFAWFGLYPAKASVDSAEETLRYYSSVGSEDYKQDQKEENLRLSKLCDKLFGHPNEKELESAMKNIGASEDLEPQSAKAIISMYNREQGN